ncbi:MAG TPA: ATP-binding protein, partial [bacterium]
VSTVRDDKGAPVWLMASIVDISERKRTADRQRELEEQLFQAQKMESIGRLVGGIAHDFNNMLTPMLGYAELALAALDTTDPTHRHIQVIRSAAERASDLTRKMLMFGRRRPLRKSRVDIGPEIQSVVDMLKRVIHETVIIDAQIDRDVGQIEADPALMHQLVMNLALNARDAMPQGGALTIQARRTTLTPGMTRPGDLPPGPYVRVSVQDTGHGMDAETVNRIFDPFFTTKPEGKGTGLGLSVVYGIVNQHGGQVTVTSKPGLGSTFVVYLPAPAIAAEARKAVEHAAHTPQSATILVVEDDPQVLGLVSAILGGQGYALLPANGPDEALRVIAARSTPPDLLLCDVVMPKMNGPTLAKQILGRWPGTRVLFMSGYAKDVAEEHGLHQENATLLDKPFSVDELSRAVRRALETA